MPMKKVEILRAACCVAGSDRNVCEREHPLLQRLAHEAGVGAMSLRAMIDRASTDAEFHKAQFDIVRSEPDETMKTLFHVAIADGVLKDAEREVLRHFAEKLGMPEPRFAALLAAAEKHTKGD